MKMSKREYAEAIAREINGAEVREVEKANGIIFTGIAVKYENNNVSPTCYIDKMYENEVSIENAVTQIKEQADAQNIKLDISWIYNWENVKERLTVRLYNEATKAEIFRSAKKYGFDDLIIIPYINVPETCGSIKITSKIMEMWDVSKDKLFRTAIANTKNNITIKSMAKTIVELQSEMAKMIYGNGVNNLPDIEENGQNIVSNKEKLYGAIAVIFAHDRLMEIYPNGYIVLPSSVHEVIVLPYSEDQAFNNMVNEVNESKVAAEEVLGHKAYLFKKKGVE